MGRMPSDNTVAEYAIQRALKELRQGRKQSARSWALRAISLQPDLEEPWLIMAAVASPQAGIQFYQEALRINPASQRAQQGLNDLHRQLQKTSGQNLNPRTSLLKSKAIVSTTPGLLPPIQSEQVRSILMKKKPRQATQLRYKHRWGLLLIAPWLIGLILFKLAPILATFGISFTDFFLLTPNEFKFVGLKNYINLFQDPNLVTAFIGTFKLALIVIPIQVIAAILLASLLNDERLRMKNTLRVLFFLPSIIPSAAALFMWQGFVNPRSGWLNPLILNPLGLAKYVHFTSRGATPSLMILATFWSIGPGFLIILGAMQGIPTDVFEAALVDGATRLRRFFSITLPLITPAIFFTLILNLTAIFGGAILLDRGYNFNSNLSSVDTYLYFILFNTFRLGSAASLAWIFFIFMLVLVLVLFITSKYWVYFPDQEN
jgi:ABC-type sugar transport system permease subunit